MINDEIKNNFYKAMQELQCPNSAFLNADLENEDFKLELKYTREDFISDVKKAISNLDKSEQMNITGFFGFAIEETEKGATLRGYPSVENLNKEDAISYAKVYHYVKKFALENEIFIKTHPIVSKCLNAIIAALPEFLTLVGKTQHHTHSYTVDVHTLKVLQGVLSHPSYALLPNEDKKSLQIAVLMHDITKKEGEIDKTHPACSAKDTAFILNKFDIPQTEKEKICLLIRNHDWLERYNKGVTPIHEFAETLKNGNDFMMLCIMAEADLKAVQRCGAFYSKYGEVLNQGYQEINGLINERLSIA